MQFKNVITSCLALPVAALILASCAYANGSDAMAAPDTAAAAPAPAADAAKAANQVTISNFTFSPQTLTVPAGTTVTWLNSDDTIHRVRIQDLNETSAALDTDGKYSFKFDKPGTYKYFCTMHPVMQGTVIVEAPKGG
jgi:plastocyanin